MNEHRNIAINESSQVHALVYVGDQIGDLIEAIKGFVKVGDVAMHIPSEEREPAPKAKKPETAPTKEVKRSGST